MKDQQCVSFLQWALPHLNYRWQGFRKVRKQVCKRINKRMKELGHTNIEEYRHFLDQYQEEWEQFDKMTRITISRFYRDKHVHEVLEKEILPVLSEKLKAENRSLKVWSAGSASGEEPYTLSILLHQSSLFKNGYDVTATEIDDYLIQRAKASCYPRGALKELPDEYRNAAFEIKSDEYCLKQEFKENVTFKQQDIRKKLPDNQFDLVLCRNLVSMYFNEDLQLRIFSRILDRMYDHSIFVLGTHEKLPEKLQEKFTSLHHEKLIFYQNKSFWKNQFHS